MTQFVQDGKQFRAFDETAQITPLDGLPKGTYTVGQDIKGWFFTRIEDYTLGKIYGNVEKQAERIRHTFHSRPAGTGVLLSGEKGSGKTTLAKLLSIQLMDEDVPTIVINQPWCGEAFNKLIQSITQPAVIVFDEFEKVYHDRNDQNAMLTLLDGVYPSKKLFILTTNDRWGISEHMRNRPGRLFYHLEYKGLEEQFVIDYCNDNLNDKKNLDGVVHLVELFEHFNFDILKAVVEEMNRYNETAKQALAMMNVKAESWSQRFEVRIFKDDKELVLDKDSSLKFLNPTEEWGVYLYEKGKPEVGDTTEQTQEKIQARNFQAFDEDDLVSIKRGVYTMTNKEGYTAVLTKKTYQQVDYSSMALAA